MLHGYNPWPQASPIHTGLPPSQLGLPSVGMEKEERPGPWRDPAQAALTPGRSLSSSPQLLGKQRAGSGQKAAGQTEWRVGIATGSGRGPRFLGWDREAQWVLGRARLLNSAFANHFLSLFSGGSTPRPPEMTSESFASHCLYLPGPAGTLPRRPLGQRVG